MQAQGFRTCTKQGNRNDESCGRPMIRVLLADDQAMIRAGFKLLIDNDDEMQVVGEAETGAEAIARVKDLAPDVVLMDVQMPDMDGIQATEQLSADPSVEAKVVIVTTFQRDDYLFDALRAGASGFLLKTAPPEDLVNAVRVVAEGKSLLDPNITGRVISQFATAGPGVARSERLAELTDREREVLEELAVVFAYEHGLVHPGS